MAIQQINLGSQPKGVGGNNSREAGEKINANFEDLDERVASAKSVADSKTTNATDAHLLNRSNHTGTQSISTILGLQVALDSAASQINITGNASTAGKLKTPVQINGVDFDGSQSINIVTPGGGAGGSTSYADTAGKLANPVQIHGVNFDGGAGFDIPDFTAAKSGVVPAAGSDTTKYLRSDGTWQVPMNTTYTVFGASPGLVPAKAGSTTTKFLREDGTWVIPTDTQYTAMTAIAANTGTGTTDKTITPAILKSAIQYHAPEQTDISGNAATASKLASAVNINGVPFDGSQSINIETGITYAAMTGMEAQTGTGTTDKTITPAVLKSAIQYHAPEQTDITGNAATATKLATAVNINGVSFDGSQSISIDVGNGSARQVIAACAYTPAGNGTNNLYILKNKTQYSESWTITTTLTENPFKVGDVVNVSFSYYSGSNKTYSGNVTITGVIGLTATFSTPGISGITTSSNTPVTIGAIISNSENILSFTQNSNSYTVTVANNPNGNKLQLIVDVIPIGASTRLHSNQTAATELTASFESFYYSIVSSALTAVSSLNAQYKIMVIA